MDMQSAKIVATGTDPDTGYDSFRLGGFTFRGCFSGRMNGPMLR